MATASAPTALITGIFLITAAYAQQASQRPLAPPRPPTRQQAAPAPAVGPRTAAQAKSNGGPTQGDLKQFATMMEQLPPKQRKQLTRAIKKLTPDERRQLIQAVQAPLAGKSLSQAGKRREIKKIPPLPRRLVF